MPDLTAMREHLAALRWNQRLLANVLGVDDRLVRRWFTGAQPMPAEVAAWLTVLGAQVRNAPDLTTGGIYQRPAERAQS